MNLGIRYRLFKRRERETFEKIDNCPCGTRGSCDSCAGPADYLHEKWLEAGQPWQAHPLYTVKHKLFGPLMGCSCNRCFNHPWRLVWSREYINDRVLSSQRHERLERRVRELERKETR